MKFYRVMRLLMAAALLTVCACGKPEPEQPAVQEPEEIRLTVWGPQEQQTFLQERMDALTAEHGDETITIRIETESENTVRDTVLTAPERAADVFLIREADGEVLREAGLLLAYEDGSFLRDTGQTTGAGEALFAAVNAGTSKPEWAREAAAAFGE